MGDNSSRFDDRFASAEPPESYYAKEKKVLLYPVPVLIKKSIISYCIFEDGLKEIDWKILGTLDSNYGFNSAAFQLNSSFSDNKVIPSSVKVFVSKNIVKMLDYTGSPKDSNIHCGDIFIEFIKVQFMYGKTFVFTRQKSKLGERKVIYVKHEIGEHINVSIAELRTKYL